MKRWLIQQLGFLAIFSVGIFAMIHFLKGDYIWQFLLILPLTFVGVMYVVMVDWLFARNRKRIA